jgi:hypothetical protein
MTGLSLDGERQQKAGCLETAASPQDIPDYGSVACG